MLGFVRKLLIWLILLPALLLALLMAGPQALGMQVCTVQEDAIGNLRSGSLLYVRDVDYRSLSVGDVITYMVSQEEVQTHRIAGVVAEEENPEEIRFRTRRDSGEEDATLVYYRNVLGVPVVAIPVLGYGLDWLKTPAGVCAAAAAALVWLLLVLAPVLLRKKKPAKGGKYLK